MRKPKQISALIPSLLDRLMDEDVASTHDVTYTMAEQARRIKANVKRDLENLLNTRLRWQLGDSNLEELNQSILNYGLPDFSHIQVESDSDLTKFANQIKDVISRFEPRFKDLRVEVEDNGASLHRALYVKISAVLMVEPEPMAVVYDSNVHRLDKRLNLREIKYG